MSEKLRGAENRIWTPSNIITIVRILLVPVFVAVLLTPWPEWFGEWALALSEWKSIVAAGVFVLISCTDWLDGYLARSRNEVTDFGKFMDPLADKILVAGALIALVELGDLPTWVVLIILAREFIVSGVRMMAASKGVVVAASMLGKFKTVFQMIAIVLFTIKDSHMIGSFGNAVGDILWDVSWLIMLVALALTIASMVDYLYKARELLGFGSGDAGEGAGETASATPPKAGLNDMAARVVSDAAKRNVTLATAESLTGGMIGATLTAVAGSSEVYKGSVVSYVNEVKQGVLNVDAGVLSQEGAVCSRVAEQMADNVRSLLDVDIAVSVTGIAGPGGAEPGKPVGTVWLGVSTKEATAAHLHEFSGNRDEVRRATVAAALDAFTMELEKG